MITPSEVIDIGSRLPAASKPQFQKLDARADGLQGINGPKQMVVFVNPEKPEEILNHPALGPALSHQAAALFKEGKKPGSKELRSGSTTVAVQGLGTIEMVHVVAGGPTKGSPDDDNGFYLPMAWRDAVGTQLKDVVGENVKNEQAGTNDGLAIYVDSSISQSETLPHAMRAVGMGLGNVGYEAGHYRSEASEQFTDGKSAEKAAEGAEASPDAITRTTRKALKNVYLYSDVLEADAGAEKMAKPFEAGDGISRVQSLVKFLTEAPHNLMTSEVFVRTINKMVEVLKTSGVPLELEIYGPHTEGITVNGSLDAQGLNVLKAVHQGSVNENGPFMVRAKYRPESAKGKPVQIVAGKTLVFDDGGKCAKGKAAEGMQGDMMGGASVAGQMALLAEQPIDGNIDFTFAVVSNTNDGAARNMEDIMTHASGKTTREMNTDAEGRQALGDVIGANLRMLAAEGAEISEVSSFATLTGHAILVSSHNSLVITDSRSRGRAMEDVARQLGDQIQFERLEPTDTKAITDTAGQADLGNIGRGNANLGGAAARGAMAGAAYIRAAAGIEKTPFVHFDIAPALEPGALGKRKDVQGMFPADGYLATMRARMESVAALGAKESVA